MPYADPIKQKEYSREYYQKNKDRLRSLYAKNKRLRYQSDPERGREEVRKWRRENPEKWAECNRNWHKENKDKINKWRKENPEKMKTQSKKRYQKNKTELNRKSMDWQKKNPHRFWSISTLSNHKRKGLEINISIDELELIARETSICVYCGEKIIYQYGKGFKRNSPSLDRINNGNKINKDNIQIICHRCNTHKGDKTHKEFVEYCKNIVRRFG